MAAFTLLMNKEFVSLGFSLIYTISSRAANNRKTCAGYVTAAMKYEIEQRAIAAAVIGVWDRMQSQIMKWNSTKSVAQLLIMHDQIKAPKSLKPKKTEITEKIKVNPNSFSIIYAHMVLMSPGVWFHIRGSFQSLFPQLQFSAVQLSSSSIIDIILLFVILSNLWCLLLHKLIAKNVPSRCLTKLPKLNPYQLRKAAQRAQRHSGAEWVHGALARTQVLKKNACQPSRHVSSFIVNFLHWPLAKQAQEYLPRLKRIAEPLTARVCELLFAAVN